MKLFGNLYILPHFKRFTHFIILCTGIVINDFKSIFRSFEFCLHETCNLIIKRKIILGLLLPINTAKMNNTKEEQQEKCSLIIITHFTEHSKNKH